MISAQKNRKYEFLTQAAHERRDLIGSYKPVAVVRTHLDGSSQSAPTSATRPEPESFILNLHNYQRHVIPLRIFGHECLQLVSYLFTDLRCAKGKR